MWRAASYQASDLLLIVNASPYTNRKHDRRLKKLKELVKKYKCPAIYLNGVGAQDSLVFDGGSFVLNQKGQRIWQGNFFKPDFKIIDFSEPQRPLRAKPVLNLQEQREQALILGIKEFFSQTGFSKAVLGLSGGMDSALTAYLAVKALGESNVQACFLPSSYTQKISFKLARQISANLNIDFLEKNIQLLVKFFLKELPFKKPNSLTYQNLQSRIRMVFLMAVANENSSLLLCTGNKSEIATGYTTLYGDMCGALCPIGDLFKTQVYDLAYFINKKEGKIFPKTVLTREPSAELVFRQKDRDELLDYIDLDPLLESVLKDKNPQSQREKKLNKLIAQNEFKRAQAPVILKISERDFGESWRKPIAHKFRND